jgi:hypothetical protein
MGAPWVGGTGRREGSSLGDEAARPCDGVAGARTHDIVTKLVSQGCGRRLHRGRSGSAAETQFSLSGVGWVAAERQPRRGDDYRNTNRLPRRWYPPDHSARTAGSVYRVLGLHGILVLFELPWPVCARLLRRCTRICPPRGHYGANWICRGYNPLGELA